MFEYITQGKKCIAIEYVLKTVFVLMPNLMTILTYCKYIRLSHNILFGQVITIKIIVQYYISI